MLVIYVPGKEFWDDENEEFLYSPNTELKLEHSLVSMSKWESRYHKPFLSNDDKTYEEILYYIKCMILDENIDKDIVYDMTDDNINDIDNYINDSQTATWFSSDNNNRFRSSEQVTSELIYYWMINFNIPYECQKWHLNRLLTLIKICNIKNGKPKKLTKEEAMNRHRALNAARRKKRK